ncbi:MAG: carbamoyl phosphate synthase small subunit [Clostridia bacterium]|nr:carbamoyl phosphate synthase small subunit [Clostridia bacterium]
MSQFLTRADAARDTRGTDARKPRYLVLSDGTVYEGYAFGADADAIGELVFTTGMCGYIETLTDPSYYGQIVLQTYPLIGNYGIIEEDFEGDCFVRGYVVREWCEEPSNFRCQGTLDAFLKEKGVPGIYGIDTREITKTIREHGVMNAILCDTVPRDLSEVVAYTVKDAVVSVTSKEKQLYPAAEGSVGEEGALKVALLDYGAKRNIIRELQKRGCDVLVLPATTSSEELLKEKPDGIMLSNGPGDPAEAEFQIRQIRKLLGLRPIFGICLGHQLTALATGAQTTKMKYGHRGVNQPCRDLNGTRTFITSQNHGYAVVSDTVTEGVERYINANDKTCEGIDYPQYDAFTVQFHPEAHSGPQDTAFLFDRFVEAIRAAGGGEPRASE